MRSAPSPRLKSLAPMILIAVATFVAFAPVLTAEFVTWDDNTNFTENPYFRGVGPAQLKWMWTTTLTGHYIPLSWMTLGLDYSIWGMEARGYHLTNLLLHVAAAIALYMVAVRLLARARPEADPRQVQLVAVATALLFSIHPLRVESVAWVTERRDMLSLLLMLGSVLSYLRFAENGSRRAWAASLALFASALLSKATVVTLPLVLLILEWYPLGRLGRNRKVLLGLAPFFALSVGAGALSLLVLHPPAQLDLAGKVAVSAYGIRFYITRFLWPAGLSPLHAMPRNVDLLAPTFISACVFVVIAAGIAMLAIRRNRGVAAIVGAAVVMMLPLIGIVQNGPQIVAERYTYHAAAALSMLPALLLFRWHSRNALVIAAVGALALGVMTWRQALVWRNSESLWTRVLSVDGESSLAQIGMGNVRINQGRYAEALEHYQRGVALDPDYAEGQNNLGSLLSQSRRFAEAIPHFERAAQLEPGYVEAWLNSGIALAMIGRYPEAVARFDEAIRLDPNLEAARQYRAQVIARMK